MVGAGPWTRWGAADPGSGEEALGSGGTPPQVIQAGRRVEFYVAVLQSLLVVHHLRLLGLWVYGEGRLRSLLGP